MGEKFYLRALQIYSDGNRLSLNEHGEEEKGTEGGKRCLVELIGITTVAMIQSHRNRFDMIQLTDKQSNSEKKKKNTDNSNDTTREVVTYMVSNTAS